MWKECKTNICGDMIFNFFYFASTIGTLCKGNEGNNLHILGFYFLFLFKKGRKINNWKSPFQREMASRFSLAFDILVEIF
jgi:hypothetical protein